MTGGVKRNAIEMRLHAAALKGDAQSQNDSWAPDTKGGRSNGHVDLTLRLPKRQDTRQYYSTGTSTRYDTKQSPRQKLTTNDELWP
ncbi:hypothetical protein G5I_07162 [Acromyrmex echinatior]|uniref:Uncharacterized protein n=1 Tax=Acromyrmex echinatior TaxID=103372 RepID=F4WN18_ACREC|nr:hypothetical protein G5I_07162 [Acromyrmex echinatior]